MARRPQRVLVRAHLLERATLGFTIAVGTGANGLEGMVPASFGSSDALPGSRAEARRSPTASRRSRAWPTRSSQRRPVTYVGQLRQSTRLPPIITGVSGDAVERRRHDLPGRRTKRPTRASTTAPHRGALTCQQRRCSDWRTALVALPGLASGDDVLLSRDVGGRRRQRDDVAAAASSRRQASRRRRPPSLNCPCSIWPPTRRFRRSSRCRTQAPSNSASSSGHRSTASSPASASTRAPQNTGTHVGNLWTSTGRAAGHAQSSPAKPPRAGSRSRCRTPVAVTAEHDLRRLVPHDERLLLG